MQSRLEVEAVPVTADGRDDGLRWRTRQRYAASPSPTPEPAVTSVTVLDAKFARGLRVAYVVGVDAPVAAATVQKLEEIILTRARDLRRNAIAS